jgi:hypothetical protein
MDNIHTPIAVTSSRNLRSAAEGFDFERSKWGLGTVFAILASFAIASFYVG